MLLRTFTAALLISWALSCAALCPENVTVSCEKLMIMAQWDCKEQHPETYFTVTILSSNQPLFVTTTKETKWDLTSTLWTRKYFLRTNLYVSVTAMRGRTESGKMKSNTFSFNTKYDTDLKCLLEFPPVTLVVNESRAVVMFRNPFRFYKEIHQAYSGSNFNLTFSVNFGRNVDRDAFCIKNEPTCTAEGMFPKGENCVTLRGLLVDQNRMYSIQMNQTQKICAPERTLCPENVMVSCENLIIMARWDCEGQQPETSFKVKISSIYMGVLHEVITKDNEYDLSHVVWKSKEICLSFLYVTVTALHGGNESTEIKSKSFSFNTQETVYANCLLEFPPATLVVNESRAVVTFPNPFLFYKEINQVYKESDFQLIFSVNFGENVVNTTLCSKAEPTCTAEVMFPEGEENCVTLEGLLVDENEVDGIQINQTQKICASERNGSPALLHPVLHLERCFAVVWPLTTISLWVLGFIHL
ncbi:interferon gamma receptor 1 [Oryzias melastigma]|uniref:interferon gamma receptor 1 n=1 Tax=Oryzias melastigma TaxID=30732 RepID=UPI000CF7CB54|nr:interferon gamma receptor 1 [Oryzias melastigma]